jgi:hypothetical protein
MLLCAEDVAVQPMTGATPLRADKAESLRSPAG